MRRIETPDNSYESLKPLFGSKGHPPFYDPNDIHVHVWKKGKLGIEDNPKVSTFSKEKMSIKNCVYCKICHKIDNKFESNVKNNTTNVNDIVNRPKIGSNSYIIKPNVSELSTDVYISPLEYISRVENINGCNSKLFHDPEHNFKSFVKVVESEDCV
jgi:hypothetical protein